MNVVDLVTGSLRDIGVISEIETPSAEQGADAVTRLNELMASLEGVGICFGYNPKATTAEALVLPPEYVATIRAMLAVSCCDTYGQIVPRVVGGLASSGYNRMLCEAIYANARETRLDNLPASEASHSPINILTGR